MIYSNGSESALYACESARTGRYGADEYEYYNDDYEDNTEEEEENEYD